MNACPQCGTSNRPEARFCRQCRSALLSASAPTCPHCGTPLRSGVRFCKQCGQPVAAAPATGARSACPHCGAPVRDTARFCPLCRAPLTAPPAPTTGPPCPACGTPTRPGARFCRKCSRPLTVASPPPPSPQQIGRFGTGELLPLTGLAGRYVILEKIAQGGMGAVYKVQDRRLQGKVVAVKEMSESAIAPRERKRVLESFQREAELLARLTHPNLARVTDRFQDGERHYMVMELVEGQTLEKMLEGRSEPFPKEQVLAWADQLCDVLSYLHSQKPPIIYRDVKPANVMVIKDSDTVKLIDFGIARFFKAGQSRDTIEFGTDGYAPPEQYGQAQTDERSDVYALGVMLHQLLTLREPTTRPFHFPAVRSLNPKTSRVVDAAIAQAVEANKDKRHQSMGEMRAALLGTGAPQKRKPTHRAPAKKKKGKKKKPARSAAAPPSMPGRPALSAAEGSAPVSSASVSFGAVMVGGNAPAQSFPVTIAAGEQATLSNDVPWLRVHPQKISKRGNQATITLDTGRLRPGRLQLSGGGLKRWVGWHTRRLVPAEQEICTHVKVELKSGKRQQIPVSVTVVPQAWQVRLGWIKAVGAMLLEVAAVAFIGILVITAL